jgi:hypothetical protein
VGSVLDKAPAFNGDDPIGLTHRRETMRDDQHRPARGDLPHVALDDVLALVVERAGRLVKDQDSGIGDERPGDRDPLALPARQARAALADDGVVPVRQLENEFVGAGELGRGEAPEN